MHGKGRLLRTTGDMYLIFSSQISIRNDNFNRYEGDFVNGVF